ncbi:MAG: hypothetical protein ACOYVG_02470 [Bacteroidota bacterium]
MNALIHHQEQGAIKSLSENLPKDWLTSGKEFNADEVLNAYFTGKEEGKREHVEKLKNEFYVNLKLATSIAEELFELGNDKNLKLEGIHLRPASLRSFEILFIVNDEMFESDAFREAYILSRLIKNKYKSEVVNYSFSFTPKTDQFNEDCLAADGYYMKYGEGGEA